ncbi:transporter [Flavobacterium psychrophilum]|nr:transporter [Flavobacterium psychrophilum]AOE54169.1 transporter [Flavobacterium psychrophilum]
MKFIKYLLVGIVFGIVLTKSEAVSWYRIYEMFHFQSFHMFGIIMTAVVVGTIGVQIIKRNNIKDVSGEPIVFPDKKKGFSNYFVGGTFFGLGWGLIGTCPGPMFILVGAGFYGIGVVLLGALVGTYIYGLLRNRLPH